MTAKRKGFSPPTHPPTHHLNRHEAVLLGKVLGPLDACAALNELHRLHSMGEEQGQAQHQVHESHRTPDVILPQPSQPPPRRGRQVMQKTKECMEVCMGC